MVRCFPFFVLMPLVMAAGVPIAPPPPAPEIEHTELEMTELAHRRMALRDVMQQVQEARLAYRAKRYTEAVEHYRNALSVLPKAPYTQKHEKFIRESLSDALIARAIDYRSVGRTEDAIGFLREAIELAPDNQRAKVELSYTQDPIRTNPALTPKHVGDIEEVSRLLNLGYGYLDLGKYDEAIRTFQTVSKYDSYNEAAQRGIEKAENARSRYYRATYNSRRADLLNEVGEAWNSLLNQEDPPPAGPADAETSLGNISSQDDEVTRAHADALQRMNVPSISLDNVGIEETIDIIRNYIKRFESEGTRSQRLIQIVSDFGSPETPGYNDLMARRVSLHLDNVTMKEVMDEIARHFEIDYYYVPLGIELSYAGQDYGRLVKRVFNVPPHFFDEDKPENEDADEEEVFGSRSRRVSVKRFNPVEFLKERGITFPKGANAHYRVGTRQLTVVNTMGNQAEIEKLLNAPLPNEWNVVLNVMVVETNEENLEDLGFDWLFNAGFTSTMYGSGGTMQAASGVPSLSLMPNQRQVSTRDVPAVTGSMRTLGEVVGNKNMNRLISMGSVYDFQHSGDVGSSSPMIFGVRGVWNIADVTMLMRGLSQKKGVDSLNNPRIVLTPSREEAVSFINVREMFVPETYDEPQIAQNTNYAYTDEYGERTSLHSAETLRYQGGFAVAAAAHPSEFVRYGWRGDDDESAEGVGVIVKVHKAEPSPDGQRVNLTLTTVINDFEGFIDWGSPISAVLFTPSFRGPSQIEKILLSDNPIYQPVFKRNMINSSVTVANGAVLVMGGMKESRIVRYEDKVPVLGDLPLIGRLFRSQGEQKQRKALLIFAKVDIVDAAGRDVRTGAPDVATESPM